MSGRFRIAAVRVSVVLALAFSVLGLAAPAAWAMSGGHNGTIITVGGTGNGTATPTSPSNQNNSPGKVVSVCPGCKPPPPPPPPAYSAVQTICLQGNCTTFYTWNGIPTNKQNWPPPGTCNAKSAICVVNFKQPSASGAASPFAITIGYGAHATTMTIKSWTVNYPTLPGGSATYNLDEASFTSPYIKAYCDNSPTSGSVSFALTPPANTSYRNPPSGWNWLTQPPSPPPPTYQAGTFTVPACNPNRQQNLVGVALKPSQNWKKAPTTSNGKQVVADGQMHAFYFTPVPLCRQGHVHCGVNTTLIWKGGTATIGGENSPYSGSVTGFGGGTYQRWDAYPADWYQNPSPNQSWIVSGQPTVNNVQSCGLSSTAPSGSSFQEPCVSVAFHAPSAVNNPYQISIKGSYYAIWLHWYFMVSSSMTFTEVPSQLTIYHYYQPPDQCDGWKRVSKTSTRKVCDSWYKPPQQTITRQVTWRQPSISGGPASATGLSPYNVHASFFSASTGAPGSPADVGVVTTVSSSSSVY